MDLAVPDLHEAEVVSQHHLQGPVGLGTQESGFLGCFAYVIAVGIEDPTAAHVVDERSAVLLEDHLLAELERLLAGPLAMSVALPPSDQPGQPGAVGVDVVGDLESHAPSLPARADGVEPGPPNTRL